MDKDRTKICDVFSEMFDNEDDCGIFPTRVAYDKLEAYCEEIRKEVLDWMYEHACGSLDDGDDLREGLAMDILEDMKTDLADQTKTE